MPALRHRTAALFGLVLLACGCAGGTDGERLEVFAAASLRDALTEVCASYQGETGVEAVLNFGSSGILAVQLEQGARADVFFSAGTREMERLVDAGLIAEHSRADVLSNRLVVVVPAGAPGFERRHELIDARVERLALANPRNVPAGRYARAWLQDTGLWAELEQRVLPCIDVRAALAAVEHGGADAGIVYRTDAAITAGVTVALEVPARETPRITYPAAALAGERTEEAARFIAFLRGPSAQDVFERHGFSGPDTL